MTEQSAGAPAVGARDGTLLYFQLARYVYKHTHASCKVWKYMFVVAVVAVKESNISWVRSHAEHSSKEAATACSWEMSLGRPGIPFSLFWGVQGPLVRNLKP